MSKVIWSYNDTTQEAKYFINEDESITLKIDSFALAQKLAHMFDGVRDEYYLRGIREMQGRVRKVIDDMSFWVEAP